MAKKFGESSLNRLLFDYKKNADKRNIAFKLTKDMFREVVSRNCHYCGSAPQPYKYQEQAFGYANVNGVDRIDPDLGYIEDNVVPACKKCNYMKWTYSIEEFVEHIKKIHRYFIE